ncbi:hypothetical protein [Jiella mangrovi]|uniref:Glutamyl-tRNA reductase n=1 Tax=Jiella mangrovi TaxID=2821407 RepID=A0ABS4BG50_9HYPH|nr:hypothetical protein [Jiella mangrovi]MBP0615731.1 hypothetical protein [Jiella mangrovi]
MTSYLIDLLLVVALVVTALRCGRMHTELRELRQTDLAQALIDTEASLNRAAGALVAARHEGVDAVRALERQLADAHEVSERLAELVGRADANIVRIAPAAESQEHETYRDFFAAAQDRLHASLKR